MGSFTAPSQSSSSAGRPKGRTACQATRRICFPSLGLVAGDGALAGLASVAS